MIPAELAAALRALLARPRVLLALDFDGVLAPIVEHRDEARALPGTLADVRRLAALPGVEVALVSGRALDSLRAVSGFLGDETHPGDPEGAGEVSLVGSHGAECRLRPGLGPGNGGRSPAGSMSDAEQDLLHRVVRALEQIVAAAGAGSGLEVEPKPTGAVLHVRRASSEVARQAETAALSGPAAWPGVHTTRGKSVIEMAVTRVSKGVALQQLRSWSGADGVFYAGDDVTDETAFAELGPGDVGVKVGPGASAAAYRIEGPPDVRELLQLLVAERSQR